MGAVAVRDGQIRNLERVQCHACGRLLFRIDPAALKPGKVLETKCKCDAMHYEIGHSS